MHIEFKFSNDIFASVDIVNKIVFPYTKDRHGEMYGYSPINYSTDDEMVYALKKVAERVNMDQHEDVALAIHRHFNDCKVKYSDNGMLEIESKLHWTNKEFISELESLGAEYSFEHDYPEDWFIKVNGKRIASITFKY